MEEQQKNKIIESVTDIASDAYSQGFKDGLKLISFLDKVSSVEYLKELQTKDK